MNDLIPEPTEEDPINQKLSAPWEEAQRIYIETNAPAPLKESLISQLTQLVNQASSLPEFGWQKEAFETKLKNAAILNEAVQDYTQRMAPLSQSWMLKEHIRHFWDHFSLEQLETQALKKVLQELKDRVEHSEKEEAITSEARDKIDNELEPEIQTFLPFYFNSKDRGVIYAEMAKLKTVEEINRYRQKILKAREKREQYVAAKLKEIWAQRFDTNFARKQLKLIQKKCGDGVFQLPHIQEVSDHISRVDEVEKAVANAALKAENAQLDLVQKNQAYKAVTGQDHPQFLAQAETPKAEEELVTDGVPPVETAVENSEIQKLVLNRTKQKLRETISFWSAINPALSQDPGFSIKGGNRVISLMETHPDKLPSYNEYVSMEEGASQSLPAAPDVKQYYRYRSINIPSNADEFTPDFAANLNAKLDEYSQGNACLLPLTSLWYIDAHKQGTTKSMHSLQDILAQLNYLQSHLEASSAKKSSAEAA